MSIFSIIKLGAACIFFALSCGRAEKRLNPPGIMKDVADPNKYAQGFKIEKCSSGFTLQVYNPWQGANHQVYSYSLVCSNDSIVCSDNRAAVKIPVARIACLSTTHIAFIEALGELSRVVGVSGGEYVSSAAMQQQMALGKVFDLGYEQAFNYEQLLASKPDVVFAYGVGSESLGYLKRVREMGIEVIMVAEYLEECPLGKAEWIKVFGALLGKSKEADSIFNRIELEYLRVKGALSSAQGKPKVFINLPWNDVWYFPGGDSYMARLIADAGGDYVMSGLPGNQSHPMSFEVALGKAREAQIWINLGSFTSKDQILRAFPQLAPLPLLATDRVFNNNKRVSLGGGNDMWESGVMNPHIILKDLGKIFHPNFLQHELYYYQLLE